MSKSYFFIIIFLAACSAPRQTTTTIQSPSTIVDGKLFTALYQQYAGEYRALCFQAYNLARLRLDQYKKPESSSRALAIITDIDETVLDNSPFAVREGLKGNDYEEQSWYNWTSKGIADTVPGAPAFLKYAASKGVTVFYITNRDENERNGTLLNLQKYGLPNADSAHLLLKQNTSGKETRRQQVMAGFDVVMLIGDNLSDFSMLFDKKNLNERNLVVAQLTAEYGNRFIVLPNPGYGDWENAVYRYNYNLSPLQKDSIIRGVLKSF